MTDEQNYINKFYELLKKSLLTLPRENLALAFSGGIDSSIIAKIMKDMNYKFVCYAAGIEKSRDIESAEKTAKEINLKLKKIMLTKEEIEKALPIQIKILKELYKKYKTSSLKPNPVNVSFNLPLFFVSKYAKEKYIIVCHGPDDLVCGSIAYLKIDKEDILEETKKAIKLFFDLDFKQNTKTAEYFRKKFLMPYLDKELIKLCLSLPYEFKIRDQTRKYILRKLAKHIGLDDEIAFRERKATQYGSGIMKIMHKIAKEKGSGISGYIKSLNQ